MAADDELPRGWVLSAEPAFGTNAQIVLPAIAGVAHVLDAVYGKAIASGGFAGGYLAVPNVIDSDGLDINLGLVSLEAAGVGVDDATASALGIVGGVGASMTVTLISAAGVAVFLLVQGHDI